MGDLNKYFKGFFVIRKNIDKILKIIELHKELTITVIGFLQFSLEPIFSDGHQNMFDLFAKFHIFINTLYDNKKPKDNSGISFVLDEPDGYFHPNWQKQFIAILIDFLETNYKKFTFEIILTSHSPFILSRYLNIKYCF